MGALLSHQISDSTLGRRTTNLSLGERPVCAPVVAKNAATQTQLALATRDGFGHQRGFQQVVIRPRNADDALIFQALGSGLRGGCDMGACSIWRKEMLRKGCAIA